MSETQKAGKSGPGNGQSESPKNFFAAVALFIRQIIAELRKVVRPTRSELINYTIACLVFVVVMMMFVFGLDLAFGWAAKWGFAGG